jgi:hypothetical protein
MTCDRAQSLIALGASGDAGERELDLLARHVAACDRCAAFRADWRPLPLRELRAELPFDDEILAEVRGRVMEQVTAERPARRGWGMFVLRAAAVVVVLAIIVIGVRLRTRHDGPAEHVAAASHSQPIAVIAPLPQSQTAARPVTPEHSPSVVRKHHHRRQEPAQTERVEVASAARPDSPAVPIHMEIYTNDPNVRIIWIVDHEADSDPAPTPNRSK